MKQRVGILAKMDKDVLLNSGLEIGEAIYSKFKFRALSCSEYPLQSSKIKGNNTLYRLQKAQMTGFQGLMCDKKTLQLQPPASTVDPWIHGVDAKF